MKMAKTKVPPRGGPPPDWRGRPILIDLPDEDDGTEIVYIAHRIRKSDHVFVKKRQYDQQGYLFPVTN